MTLLDSGWCKCCVKVKTNKLKVTGRLNVQMKTMGLGVVLDEIVNSFNYITLGFEYKLMELNDEKVTLDIPKSLEQHQLLHFNMYKSMVSFNSFILMQ